MKRGGDGWLIAIAVLKLVKTALLVGIGVSLLVLADRPPRTLGAWVGHLGGDPHNRFLHAGIAKVGLLDRSKLEAFGVGTFVYACVFCTEGVGLLLRKRWAEYLTIAVTVSFIPLEVYELVRRVTVPRVMTLALNVAIVAYLIVRRVAERRRPVSALPSSRRA